MKLNFIIEKETKGAVRYRETDGKQIATNYTIGTIYIRKTAFRDGKYPKSFRMDLEFQYE